MRDAPLTRVLLVLFLLALPACARQQKTKQLEEVARDWCLTIRASQVLPVYPLTEDLQPGDVFLVNVPLAEQTRIYEKRGFLPLDQLVTRLDGLDYKDFYKDAYWKGTYAPDPSAHERPGLDAEETLVLSTADGNTSDPPKKGLFRTAHAPRAAFPSYSFTVTASQGLRLAIPIQGVPVGLGLLNASRATGSVTISDAYTYGIDVEDLYGRLKTWARKDEVREELARLAQSYEQPLFLRVVNRVYLTGAVVVSLQNLNASSAGADVGAAQKVGLLDMTQAEAEEFKATAEAYRDGVKALSSTLNTLGPQGLPGGSVRLAQASRRSVTLKEAFDRPLAIGYLGFDVSIMKTGRLGVPIPSFVVLNGRAPLPVPVTVEFGDDENSELLSDFVFAGNEALLTDWLDRNGLADVAISDFISVGTYATARAQAVAYFNLP